VTDVMRPSPPVGRTSNPAGAATGDLTGHVPYKDVTGDTACARVDAEAREAGRGLLATCSKCRATSDTARVRRHRVLSWGLPSAGRRHRGCGGLIELFETGRLA
jgi:hypothetical protein